MRPAGSTMTKVIKILKVKGELPTKILVEGHEYSLLHESAAKVGKKHDSKRTS